MRLDFRELQETGVQEKSSAISMAAARRIREVLLTTDMNLHPHAVLTRVLWRWYQNPFGILETLRFSDI